jgi:hypothetical protein
MTRTATLRQAEARHAPTIEDWYTGQPLLLVPAVALNAGNPVVCPFCHDGVHLHDGDGIHVSPGCSGPRARYLVRTLGPTEFVRLMLARLGFQPDQTTEILAAIRNP